MRFNEKAEFMKILGDLADFYNRPLTQTTIDMYWEDLFQYSLFAIKQAISKHRRCPKRSEFFPKPGSLIANMSELPQAGMTGFTCQIIEIGNICGKKAIINTGKPDADFFVCSEHYELRRKKTDIDLLIDVEAAKVGGYANAANMNCHDVAVELLQICRKN